MRLRWLGACLWLIAAQSCVGPDLEPPGGPIPGSDQENAAGAHAAQGGARAPTGAGGSPGSLNPGSASGGSSAGSKAPDAGVNDDDAGAMH